MYYSVRTWDPETERYTPQEGMSVPCTNLTLWQLKAALRELRAMGYPCHRFRDPDGGHDDNDWCVLVEAHEELR